LDGNDYDTNSQPSLMEDVRIAYILQAPQVRGKFDNAKAKQLGVPNGPIRGKLTAGQTIEFDDPLNPGETKVVKPEDVIGAQQDGGVSVF
jgi:ribonuclease Z